MSFWDDITGKSAAEAAEEAAGVQSAAADRAMGEQQAAYSDVQGLQQPYTDMNLGGWQGYQDLVLGRNFEQDPVLSQLSQDRMENINRQGFALGQGGGARLKRLMQADWQNQLAQRQQRLGEFQTLGGAYSPAANTLSQARMNTGQNVGNLMTSQGAAQAGGIMGAANARAAGANNLLQLGGAIAGTAMGNPAAMTSVSNMAMPQASNQYQQPAGTIQTRQGGYLDLGV